MSTSRKQRANILQAGLVALLMGFGCSASYAYHDTLVVVVNNQRLTPEQIHYAEQATGVRLRSGYYWYDAVSGYWGIVNGPVVGRVAPQGNQGAPGIWSQGNTVTEAYPDGGGASRNSNVGIGVITDGQGGVLITR